MPVYFDPTSELSQLWAHHQMVKQAPLSTEIRELRQKLIRRMMVLAKEVLTPHQLKVWNLLVEGNSKSDIARILGTCGREAVTKTINGNTMYYGREVPKKQGGIIRKMKLTTQRDRVCQRLLERIAEARQAEAELDG